MWSHTDSETEENKNNKFNRKFKVSIKRVKCQRTGYESTTTRARPEHDEQKTGKTETNSDMKHNKHDARRSERLLLILTDGKHTYPGRTDICLTDEATRGKGRYRPLRR